MRTINSVANIPEGMKSANNWCVFYNNQEGKLDKKPISWITKKGGLKPDSTDKLVSYDKAVTALKEGKIAAMGFGLTKETGIICIDLDCHNPQLQDKYEEHKTLLLSRFKSYAETSISGMGTHIFIRGKIPEGFKGKDSLSIIKVFDNRFIVTTGDIIPDRASDILEEQEALEWLCETYLQKNNLREVSIAVFFQIINKTSSFYTGGFKFLDCRQGGASCIPGNYLPIACREPFRSSTTYKILFCSQ